MELVCTFCGKPFTCFDGYVRKYCPECQKSGQRYAAQFKERRKSDPVVDIYAYQYGKRHALYKKGKITKAVLDEWRHQVRIKRHEISIGKITAEDFRLWCDKTYDAVKPVPSRVISNKTACECIYPLTSPPYMFVGKKPAAVVFGEERVDVKSWHEVYSVILRRCNDDPAHHETLMYLRGKVAGKIRVFLADSPKGMTRPLKIDTDMFAETHYGSETLMHILTERILAPVRFDTSSISVIIKI